MAVPTMKKPFILISLAAFVGLLVISGLSNVESSLFPRTIGNVSHEHLTEITPSDSTFAIWGFIYAFQTAWIIYSLTLLCRKDAADILPVAFYIFFITSCICNVFWAVFWVREEFGLSLGILFGTIISLVGSMTTSSIGLHKYLQNQQKPVEADVWCTRILIQNGIIFYNAWVAIETGMNLVVTFHFLLGVDATNAASAVISLFFGIMIFWFILENFVFHEYIRFVFAEYIALIVGFSDIIKAHWSGGEGNESFVLIVLFIASLLCIARIVLIIKQEVRKPRKVIQEEITQIESTAPSTVVTLPEHLI